MLVSTGEGETRVVIRGPARAEFQVDGETVQLEGSNATTWVERSMVEVERMSIVLHDDEPDDELPSYVVDGGLFRISRLDEAPAHEGPGRDVEEPAYEREFPLPAEGLAEAHEEDDSAGEHDDHEPERRARGGTFEDAAAVRSPEPPAWTPEPPTLPPPPPPAAGAAAHARRPAHRAAGQPRSPSTTTTGSPWPAPGSRRRSSRPASPGSRRHPT